MRLSLFLFIAALTSSVLAQETKTITLKVSHPGFESKQAEEHKLQVKLDKDGNPLGYFMDVKSVFCSDEKCDVITLAMEWNKHGKFVGYKLPDGSTLTKYDHEPFDKADYAKFDELIKNNGSVLGQLEKHHIIVKNKDPEKNTKKGKKEKPKDVAGKSDALEKVDAISGATAAYIKEEVVEGAAYTCFTMWHWANGDTNTQIRIHAQDTGSPSWLAGLLKSKDADEVDFALQGIARRKLNEAEMQKTALAASAAASMDGYKILIDYLKAANKDNAALFGSYQELMKTAEGKRRVYLLEQSLKSTEAPPITFFEAAAGQIMDFERFYELQLFLSLLEKHDAKSDKLYAGVIKMLEHKNFFFSRRAHAFLKDKELPAAVKTSIEAYEKKHAGRL